MEVRNCKTCGRMFNYMSGPRMCAECKQKLEDKFMEVRNYIRDNPSVTIAQIVEEMDVSAQQIHQWIREERLIFSEDSMVTIECESCGKPIRTGRYCETCKSKTAHEIGNMYAAPAPVQQKKERDKDRMRFLDK